MLKYYWCIKHRKYVKKESASQALEASIEEPAWELKCDNNMQIVCRLRG